MTTTKDASPAGYAPRAGSKTEAAVQAMHDGPVPYDQLAAVMDCPIGSVSAMLGPAIKGALVHRVKNENGLVHFALCGRELPEGYTVADSKAPDTPPSSRPLLQVDPNDPFGTVRSAGTKPEANTFGAPPTTRPEDEEARAAVPPKEPAAAAAAATNWPAAPGTGSDRFLAAVLSSGELMIQVGDMEVWLTTAHQEKLMEFLNKFGG